MMNQKKKMTEEEDEHKKMKHKKRLKNKRPEIKLGQITVAAYSTAVEILYPPPQTPFRNPKKSLICVYCK